MRKHFLYSLPFLLGLSATAQAADDSELVVVTATRTAQPADRTGESISVVTGEDLKLQQTISVTDALQLTPGAIITRNGGVGQNATVSATVALAPAAGPRGREPAPRHGRAASQSANHHQRRR